MLALCLKLLADTKEKTERLNQNPSNSSRPPSTRAPWEKATETSRDGSDDDDVPPDATSGDACDPKSDAEMKKGRQDKDKVRREQSRSP